MNPNHLDIDFALDDLSDHGLVDSLESQPAPLFFAAPHQPTHPHPASTKHPAVPLPPTTPIARAEILVEDQYFQYDTNTCAYPEQHPARTFAPVPPLETSANAWPSANDPFMSLHRKMVRIASHQHAPRPDHRAIATTPPPRTSANTFSFSAVSRACPDLQPYPHAQQLQEPAVEGPLSQVAHSSVISSCVVQRTLVQPWPNCQEEVISPIQQTTSTTKRNSGKATSNPHKKPEELSDSSQGFDPTSDGDNNNDKVHTKKMRRRQRYVKDNERRRDVASKFWELKDLTKCVGTSKEFILQHSVRVVKDLLSQVEEAERQVQQLQMQQSHEEMAIECAMSSNWTQILHEIEQYDKEEQEQQSQDLRRLFR